ncbi:tetratricopeptide repeat protein [Sediminispirochaeta bajacaliforniensis]|uniref:tetratricopeptide repeat protein n=1 Tax=Sediminispirochaeta bajacaliforniensis TaxID=148 RepID=UPI0003735D1A|nr:hypothetical protein [Sediminispirochaeta bajacaliforniensis]
MNKKRCFLLLLLPLLFASCSRGGDRMLQLLSSTEREGYRDESVDAKKIDELEKAIRRYDSDIEKRVQDTGQLGLYYRILALDLMEKKMYGPALEQFTRALDIYPANPVLFYYAGLCRGYVAKAEGDKALREKGIEEASFYLERAVELDGRYESALYASAVLALYDMDDVVEGERRTLRLLKVYPNHVGGKFLLARIRILEGFPQEAAQLYKEISESKQASEEQKAKATENRSALLEGSYE